MNLIWMHNQPLYLYAFKKKSVALLNTSALRGRADTQMLKLSTLLESPWNLHINVKNWYYIIFAWKILSPRGGSKKLFLYSVQISPQTCKGAEKFAKNLPKFPIQTKPPEFDSLLDISRTFSFLWADFFFNPFLWSVVILSSENL